MFIKPFFVLNGHFPFHSSLQYKYGRPDMKRDMKKQLNILLHAGFCLLGAGEASPQTSQPPPPKKKLKAISDTDLI